jgi:cytokinin dehydrogenase
MASAAWSEEALQRLADRTGVGVSLDEDTLAAAANDFGHLVTGRASALVSPGTPGQLQDIVEFAAEHGLSLTPRGVGHSVGGQATPDGGALLDLSAMHRIERVDPDAGMVTCQPGATFRSLVAATMAEGHLPVVLPLNLDLSVGGTLSVGGIGSGSHRFGPLVANVANLEVVTGRGATMSCGPEQHRALYDAVLAGLGRCGVIARATIRTRPAAAHTRTFYLLYDDALAWVHDHRSLARQGRAAAVEGFCSAAVQGLHRTPGGRRPLAHWFFGLHVSFEHDGADDGPTADDVLADLHPYRVVHIEDDDTVAFHARYDARFESMRRTGADRQAHPFLAALLPFDVLRELLPRLLKMLPLTLGDGHRLFLFPPGFDRSRVPASFMLPDAVDVAAFAVLPAGVAEPLVPDALAALRRVSDAVVEAGGKRYFGDWLDEPERFDWRGHLGDRVDAWVAAKRAYDPDGTFGSVFLRGAPG